MVADDNVWLIQDMIAALYEKGHSAITEYLKSSYVVIQILN